MERLQNLKKNLQKLQDIINSGLVNYDSQVKYDTGIILGCINTAALKNTLQSIEEDVNELIKMQNYTEAADTKHKAIVFDSSKTLNMVDHPSHYKGNKYECIDVMLDTFGKDEVKAFCKLNAFKYLYRADKKNGLEDMKKAEWYLKKFNELIRKKNE